MIEFANRIKNVEEYYFSRKLAEVRSIDTPEWRVINLGIGSPDQMPAIDAIDALVVSAKNPANHGYQNYKGIPQLRKAIADFYVGTYGVSLNIESEILPLMGSKEGILHTMMAFVNEGDEVLIPDPGYPTYASVAKLVGAKAVTYDMKEEANWQIDVEGLRKKDLSKVKIMWVNFPHMPTGRIASLKELKDLVDLARANRFLIVNDNPYSLILNEHPLSILSIEGADEVALELNSLSKSHNMAGWRIGWVAGNAHYVDAVLRVKSNMDSGMFLGLQHAAVEALKSGKEWFTNLNAMYQKRKDAACKILDVLGCSYSTQQSGLFVWAKAPVGVNDVEKWIDEILYGTHVFITPGFIFGETGRRHIRISLCAAEEKLNEARYRIQEFIGSQVTQPQSI
ncbi:MAG: aminotransferase class I/II-fold pyridoxal phosphate-dependent enzyme [Cytophagales bacterium]|jgi:LL-diaminopimelate aminotransferase|nr:aminotransferase class I/II-fold pyridoxal phosphate-dependent enzyme [Cytophagales bacterium]MCA6387655.1 aminotransferase class I/II-fold pyridoxal phosphate-dependent enzyme [Cytophagales bacterium]MCA6392118.1 aminotransferase class I/II-fold pyridoxal phosphate-dependent enzyme [Cytophagales bacterium]MCA6393817.1 aminotransferase class I/II-fold pyridoxal phosphate-dependent enzyme [Cytophagales bacterium]MCA6399679.1 aminotransferase class I/II-fold pyridoxal phosphate-dependent enzym